jgi:hypothetical protein
MKSIKDRRDHKGHKAKRNKNHTPKD